MTINGTPTGTLTTLELAGAPVTLLGTSGPLVLNTGTNTAVTIGQGTLSAIQVAVTVNGVTAGSAPLTIDDHAAHASAPSSRPDPSTLVFGVLGFAPVAIDVPGETGGVTVYGPYRGGPYSS